MGTKKLLHGLSWIDFLISVEGSCALFSIKRLPSISLKTMKVDSLERSLVSSERQITTKSSPCSLDHKVSTTPATSMTICLSELTNERSRESTFIVFNDIEGRRFIEKSARDPSTDIKKSIQLRPVNNFFVLYERSNSSWISARDQIRVIIESAASRVKTLFS